MNNIMTNPTPDKLEAGGIIRSGTYYGQPIHDWSLKGLDGWLVTGKGRLTVRTSEGKLMEQFTIESYEPPERDQPEWKTWPDDSWVQYGIGASRIVQKASLARANLAAAGDDWTRYNPRRVDIFDPEIYTTVPRKVIERLNELSETRWRDGQPSDTAALADAAEDILAGEYAQL